MAKTIAPRSAWALRSTPMTAATAPRCSPSPIRTCTRTSCRTETDRKHGKPPMTQPLLAPLRNLSLLLLLATLAACQSLPRPAGFTAEQMAVLRAEGFVEGDPDWSLTFHDRLLFPLDRKCTRLNSSH